VRTIVAVTGASGAVIARRLLEELEGEKHLVISRNGALIAAHELEGEGGRSGPEVLMGLADRTYPDDDLSAPVSSGAHPFDAMVIVPCSLSTLSKIACGIADTLVTRAASVCMKEGRLLVLVPREAPLSAIHLENMAALAALGVVIFPPMLSFYHRPTTLEQAVDNVVGRLLNILGQENSLAKRWDGPGTS